MAGRLAIDFGTSNTRVALWDEGRQIAEPFFVPDVSRLSTYPLPGANSGGNGEEVPCVPSLIHYDGNEVWIGKQVEERGQRESPATFRWMKHFISNRMELPRRVNGQPVTFSRAGADFLSRVLIYTGMAIDLGDEEVAFTAPVEAFEHYQEWLSGVCASAGIRRYRLLDEASAAALGYGVNIQANDVYMVFDFGGGTLDVSIVRIEGEAASGKPPCRVLGKAGCDVGGAAIDQWLYKDVLERNRKQAEDVRHLSALLLFEVERLKETLSTENEAALTVTDPETGQVIAADYTRGQFEDLLEDKGLFGSIQGAIEQALRRAQERGFEKEHIKAVLLVGGSSLIPSVRRAVRMMFGDRVHYHRPLDAVALGGAAFVGGVDFYDHIQHDYALRFYNRKKKDYDFVKLVEAGTPYPTPAGEFLKSVTVKASHDNQEFLGLNIFEVSYKSSLSGGAMLDLVFDPAGTARFQEREDPEIERYFWMNEENPTFIHAQPPAKKGDPRFPAQFSIDGNKRLCITVRDNQTGKTLMREYPVVKLT